MSFEITTVFTEHCYDTWSDPVCVGQLDALYIFALSSYRAEDWKELIWRGRLRLMGQHNTCTVRLVEKDSETLFAKSVIPDTISEAVEKAVDSSRYFGLRLDDGNGRHAVVGLGFQDRNDAFDFIYSINEFYLRITPLPGTTITNTLPTNLASEYGFKYGEALQLHIKNFNPKPRPLEGERRLENTGAAATKTSGPLSEPRLESIVVPPPPPSGQKRRTQKVANAVTDPAHINQESCS